MENTRKYAYVVTEDTNEYFCPLDVVQGRDRLSIEHLNECVEVDVVARYSGNLDIV